MIYSILIITCCLFSSGCVQNFQNVRTTSNEYFSNLEDITTENDIAYFYYLLKRLGINHHNFTLHILSTDERISHFVPENNIFFSSGFISRIASEGEFAFVVAHEIGHSILKHQDMAYTAEQRKECEFDADNFAIKLITNAGYNKEDAIRSILRTKEPTDKLATGYPTAVERVRRIMK